MSFHPIIMIIYRAKKGMPLLVECHFMHPLSILFYLRICLDIYCETVKTKKCLSLTGIASFVLITKKPLYNLKYLWWLRLWWKLIGVGDNYQNSVWFQFLIPYLKNFLDIGLHNPHSPFTETQWRTYNLN